MRLHRCGKWEAQRAARREKRVACISLDGLGRISGLRPSDPGDFVCRT
jgi:hypothetical protein